MNKLMRSGIGFLLILTLLYGPNLSAQEMPEDFTGVEEEIFGENGGPEELDDPIEGLNRFVFAFNDMLDTLAFRPLAGLYRFVTPEVVKKSVKRFFKNLNEPVVLANELLQLNGEEAAITTGRFLINSTAGIGGLFDVAGEVGLPQQSADFGQTLFSYGVGPGPYVVLPLLGPSSARHAVGRAGDTLMNPRTYIFPLEANVGLTAGDALVVREELIDPIDQIKFGSIDYYAALKSAYYQNRLRSVREEQDPGTFRVDDDTN